MLAWKSSLKSPRILSMEALLLPRSVTELPRKPTRLLICVRWLEMLSNAISTTRNKCRKLSAFISSVTKCCRYEAAARSSVPSPKSLGFRCVQNGPPARREEGAYLDRYVTDEQRSRRLIFNATLRAAASWLFFRVARSTRIDPDMGLRSRLEKLPTDLRRSQRDLGEGALSANQLIKALRVLGYSIDHRRKATFVL